ncbi:MAG TPA: threonine synthase [Thermoanaerobaculia bacterium]|nr:threonine synthase [Thermoanaerobaculia bacterium]
MRLISSRDPRHQVSFKEAVLRNLPDDGGHGGLFVPAELRPWPDVAALLERPWTERCATILDRLIDGEYGRPELDAIAGEAFDFPVPLAEAAHGSLALELFHGPSLAFKDFGARFLAAVLGRLPATGGGTRTVLTATSGDTGAAVAAAFWRRPGFRVAVLYPQGPQGPRGPQGQQGRISPLQERQIACLGDNVRSFAVAGSFDDCQRLVKVCFADRALSADLGLVSANSINVARLLAQVLYYFEAVALLRRLHPDCQPVIAVPSGNFGNLCAGLYARALGLPIRALVAATNANRTVPDYLDGGGYTPRPSVATLSNAMDVGDPSNWERILHLYGRDRAALRGALRWGSADEAATVAALRELWAAGYRADPHGAVAYQVLRQVLRPGETGLFLATAHPAKFHSALARLGLEPALPPALAALLHRPLRAEPISPDPAQLAARMREAWPA